MIHAKKETWNKEYPVKSLAHMPSGLRIPWRNLFQQMK